MVKLSPSLTCADLLHLGDAIKEFEKNNIDYIHYDLSDTTFTKVIMLPMNLIPQIKKVTKIPLDIHIMVDHAENVVDAIKSDLDKNDIISVQVEGTTEISNCLLKAKEFCKCGVVYNMATPLTSLEYVADIVDMVILIQGNGGAGPRHDYPEIMCNKIKEVKEILKRHNNDHCEISIDGNVMFETSPKFMQAGADVLVLGTRTLFSKDASFAENYKKLKELCE